MLSYLCMFLRVFAVLSHLGRNIILSGVRIYFYGTLQFGEKAQDVQVHWGFDISHKAFRKC